MNILFVLYWDFTANSANPLVLYARELHASGHNCAIAVPARLETVALHEQPAFRPVLYADAIEQPQSIFPDGRPADVIHACTPREVVRQFLTPYLMKQPTPLVFYLEDNEFWISTRGMGLDEASASRLTDQEIAERLPVAYAHPFDYECLIGLADAVAVIQSKLEALVPPWVPVETVMIGVDVNFFSPRSPDLSLRKKYGVAEDEKVIVYHGGLDGFKASSIETLCKAVGLINQQGYSCRLLRSGLSPLGFLARLPQETASAIIDLGMLPKHELPALLALADVFVQPGRIDAFEDMRLPGKVPEFLAMGRPVLMPNVNIAHLFEDGVNAILLQNGGAEEIAAKCIEIFSDPQRANAIGRAGRLFAEKYFDVRSQAHRMEAVYRIASNNFKLSIASEIWGNKSGNVTVPLLLARKLRLLAELRDKESDVGVGRILKEHARYIELMQRRLGGLAEALAERDGQIAHSNQKIAHSNQITNELYAFQHLVINSTIWKLSSPLRKLALVKRFVKFLIHNPNKFFHTLERLIKARSSGGWPAFKRTLKAIPMEISPDDNWLAYRRRYGSMIRTQVNEQISGMSQKPLISVLLPTYETPGEILREALDSVIAQLYPEWELCIADDGSTQPHVRKILEAYARRDERIRVCFHDCNTGVSAATNRALSMARGEYSVLLDHNDRLESQALFRVAESVLAVSPDMIYSDEALLSSDGKEVIQFVFRSAFSLELLRSHQYIGHMVAFRTALVREIGGLDESLRISQDYDLILRMVEKSHAIVHIPEVLYSWRQQLDSASHTHLDQVMETSSKILAAHLLRSRETATVTLGKSFDFFEIRYPLQAGLRVAIIIPTKNHGELVRQCVESLERTIHDICYDIVVIDHASTDTASLAYFAELGQRHRLLHYKGPFNFSAINNWAVSQIGDCYSHYLFCNNDIEAIEEGWLNRMLELGQKPDVGIVGAALLYPDRHTYQHAGVCVGMHGIAEHFAKFMDKFLPDGRKHPGYMGSLITNHELSAVTAACLLMRKDAFAAIRGFDETFAVGFGDVDLCLRSSGAGYRVLYCPHAELIHHESYTRGKSTGGDPHPLDSALLLRRWRSFLETGDPYFNPNLSVNDAQWGTKNPMEFRIGLKNRIVLSRAQHNELTE